MCGAPSLKCSARRGSRVLGSRIGRFLQACRHDPTSISYGRPRDGGWRVGILLFAVQRAGRESNEGSCRPWRSLRSDEAEASWLCRSGDILSRSQVMLTAMRSKFFGVHESSPSPRMHAANPFWGPITTPIAASCFSTTLISPEKSPCRLSKVSLNCSRQLRRANREVWRRRLMPNEMGSPAFLPPRTTMFPSAAPLPLDQYQNGGRLGILLLKYVCEHLRVR